MNPASNGSGKDGGASTEGVLDMSAGCSRRLLLGRATSSLALATSALILPSWLQGTEAREGALGGARGGRHGKNHRGRHRHRSHGGKKGRKDQTRPGRFPGYKGIKFLFEISGGRAVFVKLYEFDLLGWEEPGDNDWGTFGPGKSGTYDSQQTIAALQIDHNLWVKGENPPLPWENPGVWLGHGGSFGSREDFGTGTAVAHSVLSVGGWSYKLEMDGYAVQAIRLADTDLYKVFNVKIMSPNA